LYLSIHSKKGEIERERERERERADKWIGRERKRERNKGRKGNPVAQNKSQ
jgi:hypothetical protein